MADEQPAIRERIFTGIEMQRAHETLEEVKGYMRDTSPRTVDSAIFVLKYVPFVPEKVKTALNLLERIGRKHSDVLKIMDSSPALEELGYNKRQIDFDYRAVVEKVYNALENRSFRERFSSRIADHSGHTKGLAVLLRDRYTQ